MRKITAFCLFILTTVNLYADLKSFFMGNPEKNFRITPLIGPAYTPELGFMLAGGIMMSMSMEPENQDLRRSSFPVNIGFTSTGAFVANSKLTSYWLDDFLRVYGDFYLKNMPDHYFGVGYETNSSVSKGSDTTAYNRFWWEVKPEFLFRVMDSFYAGGLWHLNQTVISEMTEPVASDPYILEYGVNNLNHGFGLILQYDTRDIPVNAWSGLFIDGRAAFYSEAVGSDNSYQVYQLDYRQYEQIVRKGSTLTWQIKGRISTGDVPYNELSQLGTPFDLRGYFWGQYRDRNMALGLMEYRYMFKKRNGDLSPHGLNVWGGAGTIGNEEDGMSPLLWNAGFGYRLEVQPRMNLRIDFGFGQETFGFYFNFNEAY
ncbi:MAG: BamA/TamA family outer membrane protein [Spirochaetales bacterium]|nr:BamA/TamA family outer membrane protein [Spirochaetales bacterium]